MVPPVDTVCHRIAFGFHDAACDFTFGVLGFFFRINVFFINNTSAIARHTLQNSESMTITPLLESKARGFIEDHNAGLFCTEHTTGKRSFIPVTRVIVADIIETRISMAIVITARVIIADISSAGVAIAGISVASIFITDISPARILITNVVVAVIHMAEIEILNIIATIVAVANIAIAFIKVTNIHNAGAGITDIGRQF